MVDEELFPLFPPLFVSRRRSTKAPISSLQNHKTKKLLFSFAKNSSINSPQEEIKQQAKHALSHSVPIMANDSESLWEKGDK